MEMCVLVGELNFTWDVSPQQCNGDNLSKHSKNIPKVEGH